MLEQALGREAVHLAFDEHRKLAVGLKGIRMERTYDHMLEQEGSGQTLVNLNEIDVIIGSGGILSHAPRRSQAAMMLLDSIQPEGLCRLYVDSVFMMPHLGAIADLAPDVAEQVFVDDCLVPLGTVIAPFGEGRMGSVMAEMHIEFESGERRSELIRLGSLKVIAAGADEVLSLEIHPRAQYDLGDGPGVRVNAQVRGGVVGLIIDGRGRPIRFPRNQRRRMQAVKGWLDEMDAYPSVSGDASDDEEV